MKSNKVSIEWRLICSFSKWTEISPRFHKKSDNFNCVHFLFFPLSCSARIWSDCDTVLVDLETLTFGMCFISSLSWGDTLFWSIVCLSLWEQFFWSLLRDLCSVLFLGFIKNDVISEKLAVGISFLTLEHWHLVRRCFDRSACLTR